MVEVGDTVAISYVAKVVSTGVDAIEVQGGNWYLPDEYRVVPTLPTWANGNCAPCDMIFK